jgi:hypothetical protein
MSCTVQEAWKMETLESAARLGAKKEPPLPRLQRRRFCGNKGCSLFVIIKMAR